MENMLERTKSRLEGAEQISDVEEGNSKQPSWTANIITNENKLKELRDIIKHNELYFYRNARRRRERRGQKFI